MSKIKIDEYIDSVKNRFSSKEELIKEIDKVLINLSDFPKSNKHQLVFYEKMKKKVEENDSLFIE